MKYKTLKARFNVVGESVVNLPIESLHLLHPIMTQEFYDKVKSSMEENGLFYPIVVREMTVGNLRDIVNSQADALLSPPEELSPATRISVVVAGNNRVRAATELGYTHIDCYTPTNTDQQNRIVKEIRAGWK